MIDEKAFKIAEGRQDITASRQIRNFVESYETAKEAANLSGWMPIASAPKDGTKILLLDPEGCGSGYWNGNGWMADWGNYYEYEPETTHWMPLPLPPESSSEEGK